MPKQPDATVTVVVDVSQKHIIENRRKMREQLLKQIGQQTVITEQNIEKLTKMTS